jgi:arginine decarboxylase
MIPSKFFFTKGVGIHKEKLSSFELALRDAGIAPYNLVSVSSILPPGCKKISRNKGIRLLKPGEIVFCVMARNETNEPNRLIGTAIGCAVPKGNQKHGYLSEHHCFGETEEKAGEYAEDLAASMLASTLGLKFNLDEAWDTRKQTYKLSGKIVYTSNITQTARGNKDGLWTSVVAAIIFIP